MGSACTTATVLAVELNTRTTHPCIVAPLQSTDSVLVKIPPVDETFTNFDCEE